MIQQRRYLMVLNGGFFVPLLSFFAVFRWVFTALSREKLFLDCGFVAGIDWPFSPGRLHIYAKKGIDVQVSSTRESLPRWTNPEVIFSLS